MHILLPDPSVPARDEHEPIPIPPHFDDRVWGVVEEAKLIAAFGRRRRRAAVAASIFSGGRGGGTIAVEKKMEGEGRDCTIVLPALVNEPAAISDGVVGLCV